MKKTQKKPVETLPEIGEYTAESILEPFTMKMGGTEYTVNLFFNTNGRETVLRQFCDLYESSRQAQ